MLINQQLISPKSIVVVGASNDMIKPGGSSLDNLLKGTFKGKLYVVNAKGGKVQGIEAYKSVDDIPQTDLAIISIPARSCLDAVEILAKKKGVKAFIVFSAGFSEESLEGSILEKKLIEIVNQAGATLIGPNCSGFFNTNHQSIFTRPVPSLSPQGIDMVSSSGGTITFLIESAMRIGLRFNSVWSIGNTAQIGVEDVLEYLDGEFDPESSSRIKLLYLERIAQPDRFLRYSASLINKGCRIAAIKSGTSDSGSRAASSHTGAIATSDSAVEALLRKAGIIRCYSREELVNVGAVLSLKELKGRNLAIISQAGGPAVILTDALSKGNINVPEFDKDASKELKGKLLPGAAVSNPIDIIGTGTGEHLITAIDFCEKQKEVDGIAVIYGNPGVTNVKQAYEMLDEKIKTCKLPIYPILPSVITAVDEMESFVKKGHVNFTDEYALANALSKAVARTPPSVGKMEDLKNINIPKIRSIIDVAPKGYADSQIIREIFEAAGIPLVKEYVTTDKTKLLVEAEKIGFPLVAKCMGLVHKSDMGGVVLNIRTKEHLSLEFDRLMKIEGASGVMIQPMLSGQALFVGAKYEDSFGHILLCGLGGIFVEVLKDVASGLAPLSFAEATSMIRSLQAYKIIQGTRGQKGLNEALYAEIIVRLSIVLRFTPEIKEMDINPLLANEKEVIAVDARIRIDK